MTPAERKDTIMAMRKQERQQMENAIKKYCGGALKTFTDVIIFISGYSPKCTVVEAVNIACWLREERFIERD